MDDRSSVPPGARVDAGPRRVPAAIGTWAAAWIAIVGSVLTGAVVVLAVSDRGGADPAVGVAGDGLPALLVLGPPLAFAIVGAVLVARLPRNPIGWALAVYGLNFAMTVAAESYATLSLARGGLWGAEVAAWAQSWNWALGLLVLAMALLHFPTGRLPGPGWRWLPPVAAVLALAIVVAWVDVWSVRFDPSLVVDSSAYPLLAAQIGVVAEKGPMLLALVSVVSLVVRFRRARGAERKQLTWLFYAVSIAAAGMAGLLATGSGPGRGAPLLVEVLLLAGLSAIPISIGIAVLRYRLYDIDRLVSRTLAYALVTAVLAGVYAAGVLGLGTVVPAGNDLLVAGSTLAVAALFQPVRRRVQALVDRRFHRRRHDAQRTLADFGSRLRDRVDLTSVSDEVVQATHHAFDPSHVTVWLPPTPELP